MTVSVTISPSLVVFLAPPMMVHSYGGHDACECAAMRTARELVCGAGHTALLELSSRAPLPPL